MTPELCAEMVAIVVPVIAAAAVRLAEAFPGWFRVIEAATSILAPLATLVIAINSHRTAKAALTQARLAEQQARTAQQQAQTAERQARLAEQQFRADRVPLLEAEWSDPVMAGGRLRTRVRVANKSGFPVIIRALKATGHFDPVNRPQLKLEDRSHLHRMLAPGGDDVFEFIFRIPKDHVDYPRARGKPGACVLELLASRHGLEDFNETWYFTAGIVEEPPNSYKIGCPTGSSERRATVDPPQVWRRQSPLDLPRTAEPQ